MPATPEKERLPRGRLALIFLLVPALLGGAAWWYVASRPRVRAARLSFTMVAEFPHDPSAFTQGLAVDQGRLIEGTGRYGMSELRRVDIETGKTIDRVELPDDFFGEGVTVVGDQVIQLTWKQGIAFVYDRRTFKLLRRIEYEGQGWGVAFDGRQLITSDGTSVLAFRAVEDLHVERRVKVADHGFPVSQLNELEYVEGRIWANLWHRDEIAVIDPQTGSVTAWLDLSAIRPVADREAVLNGIAYDAATKRLFVTGKNWPKLFELKVNRP